MSLWMKSWSVTTQVKAAEQYFTEGPFYYDIQGGCTLWSVDEIKIASIPP